jgi:hypothetical protein
VYKGCTEVKQDMGTIEGVSNAENSASPQQCCKQQITIATEPRQNTATQPHNFTATWQHSHIATLSLPQAKTAPQRHSNAASTTRKNSVTATQQRAARHQQRNNNNNDDDECVTVSEKGILGARNQQLDQKLE